MIRQEEELSPGIICPSRFSGLKQVFHSTHTHTHRRKHMGHLGPNPGPFLLLGAKNSLAESGKGHKKKEVRDRPSQDWRPYCTL